MLYQQFHLPRLKKHTLTLLCFALRLPVLLTQLVVAGVLVGCDGARDTWWQACVPDVTHPPVSHSPALITHETEDNKKYNPQHVHRDNPVTPL